MSIRTRKLIGAVALLLLVIVWALLAMALAQFALASTNSRGRRDLYVVAGLGWVLPAMPLIRWMEATDARLILGRVDAAEAVPHRGARRPTSAPSDSAAAGTRR